MNGTDYLKAAFDLTREPVAAARGGRIIYMNGPAAALTGGDRTGAPVLALLPGHIVNTQAGTFAAGAIISGRKCVVRATAIGDINVYFIDPDDDGGDDVHALLLSAMRNSLANIKLATDRIRIPDSEDSKTSVYRSALYHSYYQLKRLVVNISAADGLRNGTMPFEPAVINLGKLFEDLACSAGHFAESAEIELKYEQSGNCICYADSELIELMVLNLLSNSLLHTPPGGKILLSLTDTDSTAVITVSDTGEGIPPENMCTVFSKYLSTSNFSGASSGGAGLGLTIARGIAEKHGGVLVLESRRGGGTLVRATISKKPPTLGRLKAPESAYSVSSMETVLTQLSVWLPSGAFTGQYED